MYTLGDIAKIVDAKLIGDSNFLIKDLVYDSRKLAQDKDSLFIALVTNKGDGHHYLHQVKQAGIKAVLVQQPSDENGFHQLIVKDSLKALQALAKHHRLSVNARMIGITGSNGKTIVKEWLSSLLMSSFKVFKSPKSYNSQLGVALSLWRIQEHHELALIEAGISQPGEMEVLEKMIQPEIGIFTHLGDAHDAQFTDKAQKLKEKLKLFRNSKIVICHHEEYILNYLQPLGVSVFSWGNHDNAEVRVSQMETFKESTKVQIEYNGKSKEFTIPFKDKASVENALHCLSCCLYLGLDFEEISSGLASLTAIDMRLQELSGMNGNTLTLDYYNSDLSSLSIALDLLSQQSDSKSKVVILSDILETEFQNEELYTKVNEILLRHGISKLLAIGPGLFANQQTITIDSEFYETTEDFIGSFPSYQIKDSAILIKGARKFQFEKIVELMSKQTHETVLEVNMSSLQHNLDIHRALIPKETKLMAMVKAFAYGSGGHQIAKLLEFNKIDYLTVAYVDEAVQLRRAGITTPIMVLNSDLSKFQTLIDFQIEVVIYSYEMLQDLVKRLDGENMNIHLEFDTGMHRLGFDSSEIEEIASLLNQHQNIEIASVFSHLSSADDERHDIYTKEQLDAFHAICDQLAKRTSKKFIRHIANTAGIQRFSESTMDMVRLGIGLYGIGADNEFRKKLKPVGQFSSYIAQIRTVKAGEGIGYGQRDPSHKDRKIAVIAVGYADGFNRHFSRGLGSFCINGQRADVVGNVCMDMTMCDVSDIECKVGDRAIIFGEDPHVEELAVKLDTISYDILTSVSERVNRVYYQEQ
ncbi:MAG: bifunctional UDP-N-acetylmuramoyl-tripeptide:D-alanyl-D-alanine ligase/alanine racemase [Bacteroidia bacterium]